MTQAARPQKATTAQQANMMRQKWNSLGLS